MLAGVAGFVDVVGYLTLHRLFVAHMSGNTARLGVALGHGHLGAALPYAVAIGAFVAGILLGALAHELDARGGLALALEIALLVAFMVYGSTQADAHGSVQGRSLAGYYLLAALVVVALGFQTSALSCVSGQRVRTTYISGVLTNMAQALARWALAGRAAPEEVAGRRAAGRSRAALLAGIALVYLAGASAGSFAQHRVQLWSLAAPIVALLVVASASRRARHGEPA